MNHRKKTHLIRANISKNLNIGSSMWVWFGCGESTAKYEVFVVGSILGGACAAMNIASLTMVARLVANDTGI